MGMGVGWGEGVYCIRVLGATYKAFRFLLKGPSSGKFGIDCIESEI